MRSVILLGQVLLATAFTGPGCGKGVQSPSLGEVPPGPAIGTLAPEIEGEDLDGETLKLSDYRGKVVLLDFWGEFCVYCRKLYPHNRSLVHRYKDRPFVLLGVNNDTSRELARKSMAKNQLNWRSWWDGNPGPTALRWNVQGWPTIYLIDARGFVRYYQVFGPDLETAVETLVKEAENQS
jgi:thiol-disulfide isomerase/thioredoxin